MSCNASDNLIMQMIESSCYVYTSHLTHPDTVTEKCVPWEGALLKALVSTPCALTSRMKRIKIRVWIMKWLVMGSVGVLGQRPLHSRWTLVWYTLNRNKLIWCFDCFHERCAPLAAWGWAREWAGQVLVLRTLRGPRGKFLVERCVWTWALRKINLLRPIHKMVHLGRGWMVQPWVTCRYYDTCFDRSCSILWPPVTQSQGGRGCLLRTSLLQ
jgi:hypothetical protein